MQKFGLFLSLILLASTSFADEYVIGLSVDDVFEQTHTQTGALLVEYHAEPFHTKTNSDYSFAAVGQIDEDSDVFVGLGVHAQWELGHSPWFVEGSFTPGYYDYSSDDDGTDLGGHILFRTLLGLGYQLTDESKFSVSLDHRSNAGLDEEANPGNETLAFKYTFDL